MTCKFCGNVIEDNSDICFICGQKVEAAPAAPVAEAADAFAPAAPAAPVYAEAPAAPVYAAAPAAPVYAAAPAAPAAPAVADIKAQKKALKAAKKEAKKANKKSGSISPIRVILPALLLALVFLLKNLCYVFVAVVGVYLFLVYRSYNKAIASGDEAKAQKLVNSTMVGICVGLAVACVLLIKTAFAG